MRAVQPITFVSIERIMEEAGIEHAHFVKVDTEGFEHKVVEALLPAIGRGAVGKLVISRAHPPRTGVDRDTRALLDHGMVAGGTQRFSGYVLYERGAATR
jgi:hypothetical protein